MTYEEIEQYLVPACKQALSPLKFSFVSVEDGQKLDKLLGLDCYGKTIAKAMQARREQAIESRVHEGRTEKTKTDV